MSKTKTEAEFKMKYSHSATCPKCKGMVFYDGTYKQSLPLGFGFKPGEGKFSLDVVVEKGFVGTCERGHKIFAWKSRRRATRYPRAVNNKLARAKVFLGNAD